MMPTKCKSQQTLNVLVIAAATLMTLACEPQTSETTEVAVEPGVAEEPLIDDATINAEVQRKLRYDPQLAIFNVEAETVDGVVTLRGQVESEEAKSAAEASAVGSTGVVSVNNQLEVVAAGKAKGRISDAWITTKIKSKLAADPQVNPFRIDVDTKNRIVTLSGEVKTETAKGEAEKHAADTRAVRSVVNELTVNPEAEVPEAETEAEG